MSGGGWGGPGLRPGSSADSDKTPHPFRRIAVTREAGRLPHRFQSPVLRPGSSAHIESSHPPPSDQRPGGEHAASWPTYSPRFLGPHRIQSPPSFRSTARRRTCGKLAHIFAPAPRPASNRVTPVLQIHGPAANMWQVGPGSSAHKAPQPFRRAAVTRESPSAGGRLESSHLPPSGQRPAANTWQVGPAPTARPSPPRSAAASPCLALQQGAAA